MTDQEDTYGDVPAIAPHEGNGVKKLLWTVAIGSIGLNVAVLVSVLSWGSRQLASVNEKLDNQRDQHYGLQVEMQRAVSELAIQTARAAGEAQRAVDRSMLAERESRLAQEDLTMMRAAVRAHGIQTESAGDHD